MPRLDNRGRCRVATGSEQENIKGTEGPERKSEVNKQELIETWKNQDHPKYPSPKFAIGDWAIFTGPGAEEDESAYCVMGLRLEFYKHSGRFVWYYDFGDCHGNVDAESNGDDWQPAEPVLERSPYPPVCECWNCHKIRVDDLEDCVECSAGRTPF